MLNVKKVGSRTFTEQLAGKLRAICSLQNRQSHQELELPVFDEMIAKYLIVLTVSVIVYGGLLSLNDFRSLLDDCSVENI